MQRRTQNLEAAKMIDKDVDRYTNINTHDEYRSVEEGGLDFNLVQELKRQDELDDDSTGVKETRLELQHTFDTNRKAKNRQLSEALAADKCSTLNDPLFDADLSEEEKEEAAESKCNSTLSLRDIRLHGSNNNVSINIVQPGRERDFPPYQQLGGYNVANPQNPWGYSPMWGNGSLGQEASNSYFGYQHQPRFLMARPSCFHQQQQQRPTTIESMIRSKTSEYYHNLSDVDKIWVEKLIAVAMSAEKNSLTYDQRDWVYNQRTRHRHNWKGNLLQLLQNLSVH